MGSINSQLISLLKEKKKTIATMESCTGGGVASAITDMEGASDILRFSAVTYSNEYKIKMGVNKEVIENYTVYSMETAKEMAYHISDFADSDYGIGITGKLNRIDEANPYGEDNVVFVSIYDRNSRKYHNFTVEATKPSRKENKQLVIDQIGNTLFSLLTQ